MYQELAGSTAALLGARSSPSALGLHANTVRLHLERLREAGLVDVEPVHRGTVGRPQHLYSLAPGAPGLGLRPAELHACSPGCSPRWPSGSAPTATTPTEIGRAWGIEAGRRTRSRSCVEGARRPRWTGSASSPTTETGRRRRTDIAFLHCPFRELAEAYPELVCNLHRGICEGVVDAVGGGTVEEFATLYDRDPCRVTVSVR